MRIVIVPNEKGTPLGKLADAELHFDRRDGQLLDGLKLTGFAVWESQWPTKNPKHPNLRVTMPARQYGSEGRTWNLLRAAQERGERSVETTATAALCDAILAAFEQSFDRAATNVMAAPVARQVLRVAQQPPAHPQPAPHGMRRADPPSACPPARRAAANGGRPPVARPASRPASEPPPDSDDDYPF